MITDYKTCLRQRLEKLIWQQVDLFEKINLRLETNAQLLTDEERASLFEIKCGIGQLEVEIDRYINGEKDGFYRVLYRQLILPTIEGVPINEDEIPF